MKGNAILTNHLRGQAFIKDAVAISAVPVVVMPLGGVMTQKKINAVAYRTRQIDLIKYLRIVPVEPQQLVWLVPQYGVDYDIISNTNWNIK